MKVELQFHNVGFEVDVPENEQKALVDTILNSGKITVDISSADVREKLQEVLNKQEPKKTGYERMDTEGGKRYYYIDSVGVIEGDIDSKWSSDNTRYRIGNYFTDDGLAKNVARAENLLRNLRRFAATHREKDLDWSNSIAEKFMIGYSWDAGEFYVDYCTGCRLFSGVYFDSEATAEEAINEFRMELLWYFQEYKDSL